MKPIIEDLTEKTVTHKNIRPIQLLSCLQNDPNHNKNYYFYKSEKGFKGYLDKYTLIQRVGKNLTNEKFDLILCDNTNLFLGYWNDGVI